jgi:hypothetical protein
VGADLNTHRDFPLVAQLLRGERRVGDALPPVGWTPFTDVWLAMHPEPADGFTFRWVGTTCGWQLERVTIGRGVGDWAWVGTEVRAWARFQAEVRAWVRFQAEVRAWVRFQAEVRAW